MMRNMRQDSSLARSLISYPIAMGPPDQIHND
jgi:hypothetical protein